VTRCSGTRSYTCSRRHSPRESVAGWVPARRRENYDLTHSRFVVVVSMQTMERLTRAYQNARIEEFDENSKYGSPD